ncbi:hypothetical protein [Streptomyces sp. CAU 1734]|uniref:hypothetical protein n=1 Tax=Streptomyces sp. CAU 1734 TaxID=3140360 RepID=UPI0032612812
MSRINKPLLGQRAAIILLLGALTALGAGILAHAADGAPAGAALAAGTAFAGSVLFFNTIIG